MHHTHSHELSGEGMNKDIHSQFVHSKVVKSYSLLGGDGKGSVAGNARTSIGKN